LLERIAREPWDKFAQRMRGKPIDEIRTALADEWDRTDWSDEELGALSRGEINMRIRLER
jgi:hypothetical protein